MHPGTRIGPYEITVAIGTGGMGEVFRARDTRLNRDVAVKVLPKDFASDADRLRRFEQEAKTLAALNHPNVVTIHDVGVHDGAPYLVSELLEGRTLREELNGGALPVRKATEYALQIAHGLAAAHGKAIIHRDLKPENIFVTKDGRVKILDFGLAKLCSRRGNKADLSIRQSSPPPHVGGYGQGADAPTLAESTEPGLVLGTPAYMSPEQVRGEPTDHRADIFAFGCVLYEMLSGTRAFRRDTPVASMNAVLSEEQADLTASVANIPPLLVRLVGRCLEKRRDGRFQSVSDLAFALENSNSASAASLQPALATSVWPVSFTRAVPWVLVVVTAALAGILLYARRDDGKFVHEPSAKDSRPTRRFDLVLPASSRSGEHLRQGGLSPVWHPKSAALFYVSADGKALMSAAVKPNTVELEAPVRLCALPSTIYAPTRLTPHTPRIVFDVSPDGERFLMMQNAQDEPSPHQPFRPNVRVILNWAEAFKK